MVLSGAVTPKQLQSNMEAVQLCERLKEDGDVVSTSLGGCWMWGPWGLFDGVDEENNVGVVMMGIITMQCGIFGHGYGCGCWRIWVGFDLTWCCGTRVCCRMKFHSLHYIEHVQAPTLKTNVCEAWMSSSRNNRFPGRTKILWNLWCLSCRQILTPIGRNVLVLLGIDISTRTSTTQLWGTHRSDRAERAHWFSKCLASGGCQQKDFAMVCCLETNRLKKEPPLNCGYAHVFGCYWLQAFSQHHIILYTRGHRCIR